jgi:hypothetical protein
VLHQPALCRLHSVCRHPDAERWAGCSPAGLQHGFTHGWLLQFANAVARDAYLVHPAHLEFINFS